MHRLGLDYDAVRARNPDVVYTSITGYGQTGPESHRPGFDIIAQGMTGFLRMTGAPGGEPAKFGVAVTDLVAGMTAATAVLAAYIRRLRGGRASTSTSRWWTQGWRSPCGRPAPGSAVGTSQWRKAAGIGTAPRTRPTARPTVT